MTYTSKLSAQVRDTCRTYWNPPKSRCTGCPLLMPCSTGIGPLSYASLDAHAERLNAAAEELPEP